MSKITLISGSPSDNSRLNGLINYLRSELKNAGYPVEMITVVNLPAEDLIFSRFGSSAIIAANKLVEEANAVIIASPVYKASFTGVLKTYLDLLPQKGFENKLIAPLFIGGTLAHLLSIDFSLKPILASMGAKHYVSSVYATDSQINRITDGVDMTSFELNDELIVRLNNMVQEIIAELKLRNYANET